MTSVTTEDGMQIYYKDLGKGRPVVFCHGWPLTADAWDAQMLFLGRQGYRVIAHDRRSHGRSDQTWTGNDMDTYADDLEALLDSLNVHDAMLVGHSTGGGEAARYIGRHGHSRVSKAVLISAVPPHMLQTADNSDAAPMSVFDGLRAASSPTVQVSSKTWPCRSSATTVRPPRFRKASSTPFGCNA